eukprot:6384936-Prymnesium_polylepis.1
MTKRLLDLHQVVGARLGDEGSNVALDGARGELSLLIRGEFATAAATAKPDVCWVPQAQIFEHLLGGAETDCDFDYVDFYDKLEGLQKCVS